MANSDEKLYRCSNIESFSEKGLKHHDMVLNLGLKQDAFPSDQTPTPIRLIQKCEEMGLFQDLAPINPFEETFRKAAEGIRTGATTLEVSSLPVPNNADDSLHTPHVIFPNPNEVNKKRRPISPRDDLSISIIHHDTNPLDMSLDNVNDHDDEDNSDSGKLVVQQEADTSGDMQMSNSNVSGSGDAAATGTIQFLLRMPNGKMVQLSSHPVEQMDSASKGTNEKDIPIIKVDSSFLQNAKGSNIADTSDIKELSKAMNSVNNNKKTNNILSNKMSLAKQKLKQALMNNSCPATNSKSSSSVISTSGPSSTQIKVTNSEPQVSLHHVEAKKASSSDDLPIEVNVVEEKRKRNRAAAMRCREKRKTWVKELERRANDMLRTNGQLQHEVSMLRDEVAQLKTLLLAHRDCPVTQAMVQGNKKPPPAPVASAMKLPVSKDKSPPVTAVIQSPTAASSVKPRIFLSDPPAKRKRLDSSTSSPATTSTAVSVVSSPPSTSLHTLVLPPQSATPLNTSFVNMIPSVLVANPATSTSAPLGPSHVIYSQLLPCLPTLAPKLGPGVVSVAPRQAYILPKNKLNSNLPERKHVKVPKHSTHLLSTNVIKLNPNVVERDNNDSDIEILDVK